MGPMGTSINLVSLFAFIVVLGILVDDAIVVGESVYSRGRAGEPSLKAAISGTHDVAVPVTFAVLTSIVAFIPMLFLPGWLGKLMKDIPLVVIPVLFFSLVESKFILPFHLSLCKFNKPPSNFLSRIQERVATGLERFIEKFYSPFLDKCLTHRYLSLSIFVGLFAIIMGLILGGHVPAIRGIPPVPSDYISVKLTMQEGMPANSTEKALQKMERARLAVVEHLESKGEPNPFRHSMLTMGAQPFSGGPAGSRAAPEASHFGEISVELVKSEKRSRSAPEISALWRERLGPLLDIDQMTAAAEEMKAKLRNFSGLFDISDTHAGGKRELKLKLKPEGRALGLTQFDLGRQVRQAFYGEEIQRIQRDRDEVKVMLRYPKEERSSLASLAALRIRAPGGIETPLEAVASTEFGPDSPTIRRANRSRTVNIQASANRAIADVSAIEAELEKGFIPQLTEKYPDLRFSFVGERKQQQDTDSGLGQAAGIALFVIYGLLAIPFRSYLQPFLVMSVIPFGLIGAVLGHLLFGITMSQLSIFGLVALTGVVINDSLVLVHWVNSRRAEGMPMAMAARKAGSARFRPILLTSLTTFVGLLPVLFERSLQAQFLKPMAISIGFGVLFATLITLIMVPALYLVLEDFRDWTLRFLKYLGWRKEEERPRSLA
jgi:multidrug efflux pump subunit AcrB